MSNPSTRVIASELVKTDPDLADIVEEFVQGLGRRLARMEKALETSDFNDLKTAAHQLKGSAGGYGYPALTQAAARLEQEAVRKAVDACGAAITEIDDMIRRVVVREGDSN